MYNRQQYIIKSKSLYLIVVERASGVVRSTYPDVLSIHGPQAIREIPFFLEPLCNGPPLLFIRRL